jgi:hypothetical protein
MSSPSQVALAVLLNAHSLPERFAFQANLGSCCSDLEPLHTRLIPVFRKIYPKAHQGQGEVMGPLNQIR